MKRQSLRARILKVSACLTFAVAAAATATVSAEKATEKAKDHNSRGGSPFVTMLPCTASDASRLRFVSGRNPFQGALGGGAYGDIFFAGGGGSRVEPAAETAPIPNMSNAPAVVAAPAPAGPSAPAAAPSVGTTVAPVTTAAVAPQALPTTTAVTPAEPAAAAPTAGPAAPAPAVDPMTVPGPLTPATPSAHSPEPASLLLIGLGLSGIAIVRRKSGPNRS